MVLNELSRKSDGLMVAHQVAQRSSLRATSSISYLEEEHFILFLHRRQKRILCEVILAARVLLIRPLDLLLQRLDIGGKQSRQSKVVALLPGEGRALVEVGVVEQDGSSQGAFEGTAGAQG